MRRPIIAANWKMNLGPKETSGFLTTFLGDLGPQCEECDIVIAPPYVSLVEASARFADHSAVLLGAQNMSQFDSGAYTGEISGMMLKELFVHFVIIGHSERRAIFGETDAVINAKLKKARECNLRPIFCIGETLDERDAGRLEEVLRRQITLGLEGLSERDVIETVIAYEPVWAIGTGRTATADQAQEAHAFVRAVVAEVVSPSVANKVRIQYGGSVKPANTAELMAMPDIDGALVGGASLDPQSFLQIIRQSGKKKD
jgi:triosephosphate isomerase